MPKSSVNIDRSRPLDSGPLGQQEHARPEISVSLAQSKSIASKRGELRKKRAYLPLQSSARHSIPHSNIRTRSAQSRAPGRDFNSPSDRTQNGRTRSRTRDAVAATLSVAPNRQRNDFASAIADAEHHRTCKRCVSAQSFSRSMTPVAAKFSTSSLTSKPLPHPRIRLSERRIGSIIDYDRRLVSPAKRDERLETFSNKKL